MGPEHLLPILLGAAVLLPLVSFVIILIAGPKLGKAGEFAGYLSIGAILSAFLLSVAALGIWLGHHWPDSSGHDEAHGGHGAHAVATDHGAHAAPHAHADGAHADEKLLAAGAAQHGDEHAGDHHAGNHEEGEHAAVEVPPSYTGDWYVLGAFGSLRLAINYYIDSLTVCMFCMVTLIATCIHFFASGYMHDELHDVTDHEVVLSDGSHLHRPGRYHRFFQYLSLFCFSMLGLVISGNLAMTFIFWELVGICSYFLIGFYVERRSASTAANKAFIVNRVGDFGMIIGLMALWASLGTLNFGDIDGQLPGLFSQFRPAGDHHPLGPDHAYQSVVPAGMVRLAASDRVAEIVRSLPAGSTASEMASEVHKEIATWRDPELSGQPGGFGYGLWIVAGLGIFCGCVGKSAQFPLHVWLPDAMEGPTPVSALVHSATMVAAGVFLVARFYPVFAPEALFVIAVVGLLTLLIAATIAITASDIKRVLAYSTVSQLGYMMMALGLGGWLAGVLHLFTHAFFKSLLFMCSGSVIHAVHTNDMFQMGGLRKKMPWTAYTMLVGCLAIAGAGLPAVVYVGLSGYYSKDAILEQAYSFKLVNHDSAWGGIFFLGAAAGAAITAFYMFRLWYLTFAGEPRDHHRYDHAHESPPVMYVPLVILATLAVCVAWQHFLWMEIPFNLSAMLEQARPAGTLADQSATLMNMRWPNEHASHNLAIKVPVTWLAFGTALSGFLLATLFYGWRTLNADEARRQFQPVYRFLLNKWWFDELYGLLFVRPTHWVSGLISQFDRRVIDRIIDGAAGCVRGFSVLWERIADRTVVDGLANGLARWTYGIGSGMRDLQTGKLRQYVMFIAVGTVALFVLISILRNYALAS